MYYLTFGSRQPTGFFGNRSGPFALATARSFFGSGNANRLLFSSTFQRIVLYLSKVPSFVNFIFCFLHWEYRFAMWSMRSAVRVTPSEAGRFRVGTGEAVAKANGSLVVENQAKFSSWRFAPHASHVPRPTARFGTHNAFLLAGLHIFVLDTRRLVLRCMSRTLSLMPSCNQGC